MLTEETFPEYLFGEFSAVTAGLDPRPSLLQDVRRAARRSRRRRVALFASLPALVTAGVATTLTNLPDSDGGVGQPLAKLAAAAPAGVNVRSMPLPTREHPFVRADIQPGTLRGRLMERAPEPLRPGTTESVDIDGYPAMLQLDVTGELIQLDITLIDADGPQHLVLQANGVTRDDVLRMARSALAHR